MKLNRKNPLLAAAISLTLTAPAAFAVPYFWDIDGATPGAGGATPSGAWDGNGTTWSTDSTGSSLTTAYTTLAADDLTFSAGTDATGSYAITLTAAQAAKSLTFEEGAATISGGNISLATGIGGGSITVAAGAGDAVISSNLTINGGTTFNVGAGRLLTLNTGIFTRGTRAALNIQGLGNGNSTMTGLSTNVNDIVGPWASVGTGALTTYAKLSLSGDVGALGYAGGADGVVAAASTDVISTASPGTVNYNLSAAGTLGANATVNTLRYDGPAGTLTASTVFITKGIMNVSGNALLLAGAVTAGNGTIAGTSATEIVVNTASGNISMTGAAGLFAGAINKTGAGTFTLGNGANHTIGAMTVNEGVLVTGAQGGDTLVGATVNSGGTLRWGSGGKHSNTTNFIVNAGGTLDIGNFDDLVGGVSGTGSIIGSGATARLQIGTNTTTFGGVISGNMRLGVRNSGIFTLTGVNTFTGSTELGVAGNATLGGTLVLTNINALGTNPGISGTSGITFNSGSNLQSNISGLTVAAPITLAGVGNATFRAGVAAGSTSNFNGVIGGTTGNVVYSTTTGSFGNAQTIFVLGAAGNYTGNTIITTGNGSNNPVFLRAGAGIVNALPATTVLTFAQVTGGGTGRQFQYDMNGNAQELAGLSNTMATFRNQIFTNTGNLSTLTINNTANFTFGGSIVGNSTVTTRAQIQGAIALTKSGTGTFTLGGLGNGTAFGNTFTGDTTILGGTLVLGERTSLQNSAFDTTASIAGDLTNGLSTSVTTLTLGGLTGSNSFASRFTTAGGYGNVTALTLNPGTGATPSYSGNLTDGATGMTLTKSGVGTQTLAGANTFTGATTVNAGTLVLDYSTEDNSKLSDTAALILSGGTLDLSGGNHTEIVASTTLTAGTASRVTRSSGTAVLKTGNITPGALASIDFGAPGIATTDNLNNAYGFIGTWATVNGVFAVNSTNVAGGLVTAGISADVTRLDGGPQVIADSSITNVRIIEGNGTAANITLAAATTSINTLTQSTSGGTSAATIDSGTQTLRTNIILVGTGAGALTIGNGTLAPALAGGDLELANNAVSAFTIDSVIDDNTSASTVTKTGNGTVTLTGANTFSGNTTVNLGTLAITNNTALGTTAGATTVNGGNGGTGLTLNLSSATSDLTVAEPLNFFGNAAGRSNLTNNSIQNHTLSGPIDVSSAGNITQFSSTGAGSITVSGDITGTMSGGALLFLRGTSTSATNQLTGSINLTGGNLAKTDAGTWLVGASSETYSWVNTAHFNGILRIGADSVLPSTGVLLLGETGTRTPTLDINGYNQTIAGITYNGGTGTRPITSATPAVLTVNNATDSITTGTNAGANNVVLTGAVALTKQGVGTLALNGVNTNSGNTTVSEGTLTLSKAASDLDANTGNNGSTVTIAATGATLDLTYTGTDKVGKLIIGVTEQLPGEYGTDAIVVPGVTGIPQITGNGTITVVPGYSAWASINSAGPNLNDDHDNDGVDNGTEYFIGGTTLPSANTTGFTPLPSVVNTAGVLTVTWTKAATYPGAYPTDYQVETSATLANPWVPAALGLLPNQVEITGNEVKYTFPAGTINFARLKVTGP